jgi:RNA polymerase sigma factor (sigma-70 family)
LTEPRQDESSKLQEFHRIVDPLATEIVRAIWRVVRERDAAEDAFQIAMLSIWQRLAVVQAHPNPRALVLRICIDSGWYVRRQRGRLPKVIAEHSLDRVSDDAPDASQTMILNELTQDLLLKIEELPEQQSICVWLRFVEDWKTSDIALTLRISEPTVRKHIERARKKLTLALRSHLQAD